MAIRKSSRSSTSKTSSSGYDTGSLSGDLAKAASLTKNMDTSQINSAGTAAKVQRYATNSGSSTPGFDIDAPIKGSSNPVGAVAGAPNTVTPTGMASPVTTSESARQTYDSLSADIQKYAVKTPQYSTVYNGQTYTDPTALFDAQRQALTDRRNAEIQRITGEYTDRQAGQEQQQKSETGTKSMSLARMGGFDSASGQAVLTNLQRVHEAEQNTLMQARQSAILQAQQAYEDKDFELAKLQMEEAKAAEALIYNRQQDHLRNTLAIRGEERQDAQMRYQKQRDQLQDQRNAVTFALENNIKDPFYFVGGVGFDTSTGEALTLDDYLARGGKPDFSNGFIVEPGSKEARAYAWDMASKYVDAGIDANKDDLQTIQAKIQKSRIYAEQVRPPSSGGGGGGKGQAIAQSASEDINSYINEWNNNGWLNSGSIGSGEYKKAKQAFVGAYAADMESPGKYFDDKMKAFVNAGGDSWESDYGIN